MGIGKLDERQRHRGCEKDREAVIEKETDISYIGQNSLQHRNRKIGRETDGLRERQ